MNSPDSIWNARLLALKTHKKHFIKIRYVNKDFDFVKIASIFNDHLVKEQIKSYFDNTEPLLFVMFLVFFKSTRKYVFSYSKVCRDVNFSDNTPTS